jgi:fructooligosaccharide transport system substrate-binding protein
MIDPNRLLKLDWTRRQFLKTSAKMAGGLAAADLLASCAQPSQGTTTLRFFRWQSDTLNGEIAAYKKVKPSVTIQVEEVPFGQLYDKLALIMTSTNPPDIMGYDAAFTKSYAAGGGLLPLDQWMTPDQKADIIPSVLAENSYKGHVYSPGFVDSPVLMFYNKDATDAAGVSPPQALADAWTWEQAKAAFKKVRKGPASNPSFWGLASSTFGGGIPGFWLRDSQLARSAGDPNASPDSPAYKTFQMLSADGKSVDGYLNTPEAIEALKLYQSLYSEGLTPKVGTPNQFASGQAGFELNTIEFIDVLSGQIGVGGAAANPPAPFKWGVTPLPYVKTPVVFASSVTIGASGKTKHQAEAAAFLLFVSSKDQSLADTRHHGTLPPRVSVLQALPEYTTDPQRKIFVDALQQWGKPPPGTTAFTQYANLLSGALHDIALGADPRTRMNQAVSDIDQALQQAP